MLLLLPLLWILTLYLLSDWPHFRRFLWFNRLLLLGYVVVLLGTEWQSFGHDEYGLGKLLLALLVLIAHVVSGVVFAFGYYLLALFRANNKPHQ
ncbi:hypothetical protein [Hymenobacter edaphi]|uniref:Uncharacterized protein n=1 Tax=Hymenobacter edaphi TaxID=2211146 RepID=A0A328BH20_9BACT|nr:hypothetical protein [Hymenobacter edaphi]RAK65859.1 hypothetical protein DLM85_14165 [Hymenobacter edaphi]